MIAGGHHFADRATANSNEELVNNLLQAGILHDNSVAHALRVCSREIFVPSNYRQDAFIDAPIRLEEFGINLSAPHMHATMLEALSVQPGMTVLDVGTGCGIIAAAAALLTGKKGKVVAIDLRKECCDLANRNIEALRQHAPEKFVKAAADCKISCLNVFLLAGTKYIGMFDRIHVGASCPTEKVQPLVRLLKPQGGLMVVPVAPSDLCVISRNPNGSIAQRTISQVRFSDLEVPSDAEIVLAALNTDRKLRAREDLKPSTYDADIAAVTSILRWNSAEDICKLSSSPAGVLDSVPISPSTPYDWSIESLLGPPDCTIIGHDISIPAHSVMLSQRCDLLFARKNSGMADASLDSVAIPDGFSRKSIELLLHYVYHDTLDCSPEEAVDVLRIAQYFGVPRLVQLCEHILARMVRKSIRSQDLTSIESVAEAAIALLNLSQDEQLPYLARVCLDFVVAHHDVVSKMEGYASLGKESLLAISAEACRQLAHAKKMLIEVKEGGTFDGLSDV